MDPAFFPRLTSKKDAIKDVELALQVRHPPTLPASPSHPNPPLFLALPLALASGISASPVPSLPSPPFRLLTLSSLPHPPRMSCRTSAARFVSPPSPSAPSARA